VHSVFRAIFSAVLVGVLLVGCGQQAEDDERALVSDADIAALQQESVPPETAPDAASSGRSFYLRLAWGRLAGEGRTPATAAVDWSGSVSVSEGTVALSRLNYFDSDSRPEAQGEGGRIAWVSHLQPRFAGLVARVELPSDDATVTVDTPLFRHTFRASELTGGDDAVFPVDAEGHAVSVSTIPASKCPGGFTLGYAQPAKDGTVVFGGRTTDRTGKFTGVFRFRELGDGTLSGAALDLDGRELARVRGTIVRNSDGGSFSAELIGANGHPLGSLTGLFDDPSYASRGAFQGSFEQACEE
jgi:hypothetical protein